MQAWETNGIHSSPTLCSLEMKIACYNMSLLLKAKGLLSLKDIPYFAINMPSGLSRAMGLCVKSEKSVNCE